MKKPKELKAGVCVSYNPAVILENAEDIYLMLKEVELHLIDCEEWKAKDHNRLIELIQKIEGN
jgi:hypothetical protein